MWLNSSLSSLVSVEYVFSFLSLVLLLHNISSLPSHFFFQLNEQYCLAQTCFSTLVSLVRSIDRRVLKIRPSGNAICWWIIGRLVPMNLTRNESQEPLQHSYPRYGRNNHFEIVVKQRGICFHVKPLTPALRLPCNIYSWSKFLLVAVFK